jgi:hypothetical protein
MFAGSGRIGAWRRQFPEHRGEFRRFGAGYVSANEGRPYKAKSFRSPFQFG